MSTWKCSPLCWWNSSTNYPTVDLTVLKEMAQELADIFWPDASHITSNSPSSSRSAPEPEEQLAHYSLLDALLARRSHRFGKGMRLNGGPLAYESVQEPLSLAEEAVLVFAACGVTGYTMAELPYDTGNVPEAGSGNIIVNFVGRTAFSTDAAHLVSIFVLNDDGVWLLKRPQDYPRLEIPALVQAAREQRWQELYEKSRVRIAD